jgi:hypothetical protein
MINAKRMLIWEIVLLVIIAGIITVVFLVELDLSIFKIVSPQKLASQYQSLKDMNAKILTSKNNYNSSVKAVEAAKADYLREKEKYEAITDETIEIIKEATADEQYNIDYIWITIGNYASANNLSLSLIEPGGTSQNNTGSSSTTDTTQSTTTNTTDSQVSSQTSGDKTSTTTTTTSTTISPSNELSIKVVGNYIDVSSFIFELENDIELRFKLDNIKMEYAGNNQITATFAVKNLKFRK